jgi:anti-anti-sigma factor
MDLIEQAAGGITIVEPRGRIDSVTAREFGACLARLLDSGRHQLVIDLKSISYISSSGFRQLLIADRSMRQKNGKLALCGIAGEIKRLFDIGAFDDLFVIYPTREESITRMQ